MEKNDDDDMSESDTDTDTLLPTLDTTWVTALKQEQYNYRDFYTEPVSTLTLCCCYVNHQAELETFKTEQVLLRNNGVVSREELIRLIQRHQWPTYKLLALLRYNVNLNADEVSDFIHRVDLDSYAGRFLTSEKGLNDIPFPNTISIFNDLNTLFLIFREKNSSTTNSSSSTTRKIKLYSTKGKKGTRRQ